MPNTITRKQIAHESKVLIVDDHATNRLMLSEICRGEGIEQIAQADNGNEGLQKALSWKPDLLLIDMHMPGMDGLQVCRTLKQAGILTDMVVIMVTRFDDIDIKVQAFDAGVTDFIPKPIHSAEVIARAMAHLERQYYRREADAEYARLQKEISEAIIIQNVLLPAQPLIDKIHTEIGVDIAHYYHPAYELAGDYLSVRRLPDDRIALMLADISGHGVTAALYSFSLHALLTDTLLAQQMPGELLGYLSNQLHSVMAVGKFATMFLGVIDTHAHVMHYASAASPIALLCSNDTVHHLGGKSHIMGADYNAHFPTKTVPFHPGDTVFMYSDALIETTDTLGKTLRLSDLEVLLRQHQSQEASQILKKVLTTFYEGNRQTSDDLSMLVCKR